MGIQPIQGPPFAFKMVRMITIITVMMITMMMITMIVMRRTRSEEKEKKASKQLLLYEIVIANAWGQRTFYPREQI